MSPEQSDVDCQTFEDALGELERVVESMEQGDGSLSELMERYSRGAVLAKKCLADLNRAETTMHLLVQDDGTLTPLTEIDADEEG